eukprot:2393454-Amphidinium_carterae.1
MGGARLLEPWHGPATVIGQDRRHMQTARNYWRAYGTHLLLVPGEHLRSATSEEIVACDIMRERIQSIQQTLGEDGNQPDLEPAAREPIESPTTVPEQEEVGNAPVFDQEEVVQEGSDQPLPATTESHEALALVGKSVGNTKGKELDPKHFADAEWTEFLKADYDRWMAHVKTNAVKIIPPAEAVKIDPRNSLPGVDLSSQDMWRTEMEFEWTDRTVLSGELGVFDVKDAFLAGVFSDRVLYVKLPHEGIPTVEPGSLILLLQCCRK